MWEWHGQRVIGIVLRMAEYGLNSHERRGGVHTLYMEEALGVTFMTLIVDDVPENSSHAFFLLFFVHL